MEKLTVKELHYIYMGLVYLQTATLNMMINLPDKNNLDKDTYIRLKQEEVEIGRLGSRVMEHKRTLQAEPKEKPEEDIIKDEPEINLPDK